MTPKSYVRYNVHMNNILQSTQARQHFFSLIEKAQQPGRVFTVTVAGEPKVVMMSFEDFEGWQETLEIMSDKKLMKGIKEALEDVKKGRLYSAEEVKKKLKL